MRVAFAFALALLAGCASVTSPIARVAVPVLVGPIERIGDRSPRRAERSELLRFEAVIERQNWAASSSHHELRGGSVYRVDQSAAGRSYLDAVNAELAESLRRAGDPADPVIYIDRLRGYTYVHVGLGWTIAGDEVLIEGAVTTPRAGTGP